MLDPLRVVFMGTSDFAVPSLLSLDRSPYQVACVVTQPDRPAGRGLQPRPSVVKRAAMEKDLIVVVAYGQILPKEVLDLPRLACLNVHGSLLPRWRGAAPIHHAIMAGDRQSGVTLMHMNERMDEGDILLTRSVEIGERETTGELHDRLAALGVVVLQEGLDALISGKGIRTPQDPALATYAPSLKREGSRVRWDRSAREVADLIRGLDPWPSAETSLGDVSFGASVAEGRGAPGTLLALSKDGAVVAAGEGAVRFTVLQPPGKRRMGPLEFSLGHSAFKIGVVLS